MLQEVTCLDFHPYYQILASGGKDFSIRFFEFSKPSVKKAYKSIQVSVMIYAVVKCKNIVTKSVDHHRRHQKFAVCISIHLETTSW